MSKEKQIIYEMAKVICNSYAEKKDCETCPTPWCYAEECATLLFCAGYRKQSEGEWVVTDADSGSFGEYEPFIEFKCPKCESGYGIESGQYGWQYGDPIPWVSCPLCGAKMRKEDEGI